MRVVSRIFTPEVAAAAFRLRILADAFDELGADVEVLTTRPAAGLVAADGALTVRRWPVLRDRTGNVRGYVQYLSFDIPLLFRMLRARRDLTIVEPPPTTGAVVRVVSTLHRRPYVYYAGDVWSDGAASMGAAAIVVRILRVLEAWAMRGAATVLCVSGEVAQRVSALGIAPERVVVVGNGIDTDTFNRDAVPIEGGSDFVYTGTMSEWQGADIFIRALAMVRTESSDVRMTFLGQGSAQADLRALADELCPGAVDFRGLVPPADCARWIRAARAAAVSIRPHIGYDFAKPTKIYAATACGTPVIFAGVGAGQELVASEALGWAPGYDVDDVAAAMRAALLEDPQQTATRAEHCATWARDNASLRARGLDAARMLLDAEGAA
ncbi:MAG: glycosyltransferase family 4 protein [Marmoricola sp.]